MKKKEEFTTESLGKLMQERYDRWNYIMKYGCSDPFWQDGCNLNLVRNHIINYRKVCERELKPDEYPEQYYMALPPELDQKYMVNAPEIAQKAQESLQILSANKDYLWLKDSINRLTGRQRESTCIDNVVGYVSRLEYAIENENYVMMRLYRDHARYADSFIECRRKVEKIFEERRNAEPPLGQLSLFDVGLL